MENGEFEKKGILWLIALVFAISLVVMALSSCNHKTVVVKSERFKRHGISKKGYYIEVDGEFVDTTATYDSAQCAGYYKELTKRFK
ncbi:MAG TPA: hypothetical protein VK705_10100 [Ferruginibacter sp.]|jgi:hypothetical protein|nr:hypothetical protein [Ferruginibacter sp.]